MQFSAHEKEISVPRLKAEIRDRFLTLPTSDKAASDKLSEQRNIDFAPMKLTDYESVIEMLRSNEQKH